MNCWRRPSSPPPSRQEQAEHLQAGGADGGQHLPGDPGGGALEENGLVTAVRSSDSKYRSYFVFDLSSESLEDLFVARRAIEGEAAFLCAQKRTLIDLPRLQKLADQFQSAWQDFAKDLDTAPTASERAQDSTWSSTTSWC